ncbi:glycine/sarcosine/betaine reductase component B subunit [Dethiosulfovibrio faecalis]|uniref:glycine/sarcosine/betaine reductase component B subunit n=1 Tax=Dethiosulfovibrio faecalis TaxID=2720018 RepID=UPI002105C717|nr:glycine/sarcosine/betaine reductase component B subunit [Dethiosulfovibrio faecalis]
MDNSKKTRKLVVNAFHVKKVVFGEKTSFCDGLLTLGEELRPMAEEVHSDVINKVRLNVISPSQRDVEVNAIMDFQPIATKALGTLGEGVTNVLTGVVVMINGIDVDGRQASNMGAASGRLKDAVVFNRRGTPQESDYIVQVDVEFQKDQGRVRSGPNAAYRLCDSVIQSIRESIKKLNPRDADERHVYYESVSADKPKIVIVKQVAGQGGGYDTRLFGREPAGFEGGYSIVDFGNVPVIVTPNEYRDGALMCLY